MKPYISEPLWSQTVMRVVFEYSKSLGYAKSVLTMKALTPMGIASNINNIFAGLYQHIHFKYNSYTLGHHDVKVCNCKQAE